MREPERRLMICSPGIPHPGKGASTVIFHAYVAHLRDLGFRILNVLLLDPDSGGTEAVREYQERIGYDVRVLPVWAGGRLPRSPLRHGLEHSHAWAAALKEVQAFRPQAVFCQDLLSAWACHGRLHLPTVVWLGDLTFETTWYHALYALHEGTVPILRWPSHLARTWLECQLWKRNYRTVLRDADTVIVSAHAALQSLARLGITARFLPYPWPDASLEQELRPRLLSERPTFVFFGNLSALGSRSALHFLLESIYPLAVNSWGPGGFTMLLAGSRQLPAWAQRQLSDKPEVRYLGFVADLDELLRRCHAVLVPIDVPVGNRTRILTAMAKGALVIAHRHVALGNPDLVHEENCYLATTAEEFLACMRWASEQPTATGRIVAAARQWYRQTYAPAVAVRLMAQELVAVMKQAFPQAACG